MYVVVDVGEAVTLDPVEAESVEEGVQAYVVAPEAVKVVEEPEQIVTLELTVTVGPPPTVIVCEAVAVQPFMSVPVAV